MTCKESCNPANPLLAVNAAEQRLQIVLGRDNDLLYSKELSSKSKLTQILVPQLQESLSNLGIRLCDLSGIACVRGPGSLTGLRVALATILGIARGLSLPLAGIDYLPLLAEAPCALFCGETWVITHARHNLVFLQGFSSPCSKPLTPVSSVYLHQAAALINSRKEPVLMLGSGLRKNLSFWSEYTPQAQIAAEIFDTPHPGSLLSLASKAEFKQEPIAPLYLRPSDAEENLEQIAYKRGISLEKAISGMPEY